MKRTIITLCMICLLALLAGCGAEQTAQEAAPAKIAARFALLPARIGLDGADGTDGCCKTSRITSPMIWRVSSAWLSMIARVARKAVRGLLSVTRTVSRLVSSMALASMRPLKEPVPSAWTTDLRRKELFSTSENVAARFVVAVRF